MVLLPRVGWGIIFDMITYLLVSFFYYESVNKYTIFSFIMSTTIYELCHSPLLELPTS